ncbi:hypothetical protein ABIC47_002424 [Leifsonia sp. 563]|uniref:C-glycoside deglycosidase beta subunit domain-containing protein n=1 Tax=Leifsonia sp. 563 TaxID=3156412 RepID=UPI0033970D6C
MIPDRIIEQGTLKTQGARAAVEVRIPWYRALPASCISDVSLAVDGIPAPADSIRWEMNGKTFRLPDLADDTEEWWFPLDSAVVSGDIPVDEPGAEHTVEVELKLYIPYIIIDNDQVLRIEEHDSKTMKAVAA